MLGDNAAGKDDYLVRARNRAHAVSYHKHCFVLNKPRKRSLNKRFVFNVKACGGFVQKDYRRVFEERAGNGNSLPFAAREFAAVFAYVRVPFVGEFFGEFVHVGKLSRGKHFFVGRTLFAEADIFHNGVVEQRYVLKNYRIQAHQLFGVDIVNFHSADRNRAFLIIPKPCGKARNGGFSAARRSDERGYFALFRGESYVL